ncbi:MAG: hypothetical protein OXR66_03660 [Candidatus Woesearchaeota archaeon]|nr:hypothetical protein [Candidatus Woesearchaeota archaeon]
MTAWLFFWFTAIPLTILAIITYVLYIMEILSGFILTIIILFVLGIILLTYTITEKNRA